MFMDNKMLKNMTERVSFLDNIRAFAISIVVLCHSVEFIFIGDPWVEASQTMVTVCVFLHGLARIGVPLFLFLSGYLLLDREYNSEKDVFKFWKTKLLPLVFAWVVWIIMFYSFKCWHDGGMFSLKDLLLCVFMRDRTLLLHDWYMYMLIGIYCIYPFISILLKKFSAKMIAIGLGFIYVFCMVLPTITSITGKNVAFFNLVYLNVINYNSFYVLYVVLGYYLKKYEKLKFNLSINFIGFIVAMIITMIFGFYRRTIGQSCYIWYEFPVLPFTTLFLFNLLRSISLPTFLQKVSARFSICSFGIYLIHVPVQMVMSKVLDFSVLSPVVSFTIKFLGGLIISYIIVEIFSRIKYLNSILFLIKR